MDNVISRKAFAERMREISKTMKPSEIEGASCSLLCFTQHKGSRSLIPGLPRWN